MIVVQNKHTTKVDDVSYVGETISTRHTASTSMYSLTFRVSVMLP